MPTNTVAKQIFPFNLRVFRSAAGFTAWVSIMTVFLAFSTGAARAETVRLSENPDLAESANQLEMTIVINAPAEDVWRLVGPEFGKSKAFNFEAQSTKLLSSGPVGLGSLRRTVGEDRSVIDAEVVEYQPLARSIAWEIVSAEPNLITLGYSRYEILALDAKRTELTQAIVFQGSNGLMNLAMRSVFPKIIRTELSALRRLAETGEDVAVGTPKGVRREYGRAIKEMRNW